MEYVLHSERTVLCDRCGRFFNKKYFTVHRDRHNESKRFKCDFCDKSFLLKALLERHHLVHTGEKSFSCDICENSFGQRASLDRHKINVHKQESVVCDICNNKFQSVESLQNHKEMRHKARPQKQYVCKVCGRIYLNHHSLSGHIRYKHEPEKLLSCATCGKKVLNPSDLKRHVAKHEGIQINYDEPTVHRCSQCKQVFEFKTRLIMHRRVCSQNRFHCDVCKHSFRTMLLLKRHLTAKHLNISKETEDIEQCYLRMEDSIGSIDKQENLNVQLKNRERRTDQNLHKMTPLSFWTSNTQTHRYMSESAAQFITHNTESPENHSVLSALYNRVHLGQNGCQATTGQSVFQPFESSIDKMTGHFNNINNVSDRPVIKVAVKQQTYYKESDTNPRPSLNTYATENHSVQINNTNSDGRSVSMFTPRQRYQNENKRRQRNKTPTCHINDKITTRSTSCVSHDDFDDLPVFDDLDQVNNNFDSKSDSANSTWSNSQTDRLEYNVTTVLGDKRKLTKRTRNYNMNYQQLDDSDDSDELTDYDSDDLDELENKRIGMTEKEHRMTKRSRTYVNYEESDDNDEFDEFDDVTL